MAGEDPETILSVEGAVAELSAASESPAEEQEQVAEAPAEEPAEPVDGEVETPVEEAPPEAEEPAIEAPKSWSQEDREAWSSLTPEAQKIIAAREADRDRTVSQALSEKDRASKQAAADAAAAAAEFRQKAESVVPEALRRVQELEAVDLADLNRRDPALAQQVLFEREKARADYDKLQAEIQTAQQVEYKAHLAKLAEEVPQRVPDLADPEKGKERANGVQQYLVERGIPQESLQWITAAELEIAYDAYRWRQSQDKARQMAATRPSTPPTRPVRPASAAPTTSQQSAVEAARNRLGKTGDVDDAVALLRARRSN